VPPVFRLFPTDDDQAQAAAKFVASQGARGIKKAVNKIKNRARIPQAQTVEQQGNRVFGWLG
jgi:hypothetical protein